MGAWGVLAFDNDNACDWSYGLKKVAGLSLVEGTFDAVDASEDYLDAHEACNALAACETLARLRGKHGYRNAYTESTDTWVAAHPIQPPADLLARAHAVIDRVLGPDSELRDLWEEDETLGAQWRQSVEELRQRLATNE